MANAGSRKLNKEVTEAIAKQLLQSFTCADKDLSRSLVLELLTETEQRILAKRLAAVFMLIDEQSYYRIHQVLGMSSSTIKNLHQLLVTGTYAGIEKQVLRKKEREELAGKIAVLMRGGLPAKAYVIKKRAKR